MTTLAQPASPLSVSSVTQLSLSLVAIVALIFALSWVLRRFKLTGLRGRGQISVIDELAVGPRERIMLIKVGHSQVLVGVGATGLVGLTPLAAPLVPGVAIEPGVPGVPGAAPAAPLFAERLRDFMKRSGGAA